MDAKDVIDPRKIRLYRVDVATDLEVPIVVLIGAAEPLQREQNLQLPPEQREELVRDNTRRLYMAITRAGHQLVITWVGDPPECLEITS